VWNTGLIPAKQVSKIRCKKISRFFEKLRISSWDIPCRWQNHNQSFNVWLDWLPCRWSCDMSSSWFTLRRGNANTELASDDVLARGLVPNDRLPELCCCSDVQPTSSSWLLELCAVRDRGEQLRRGLTTGLVSLGDLLLTHTRHNTA